MSTKSRILLADDNDADVALYKECLSAIDCHIEVAKDGQEVLERAEHFQPDVILLDTVLRGTSGFEVCRQIKDNPATRRIMILMVAALNELNDIERAVSAGTDDFLSKPVIKLELLNRVQNMLRLRGR
jgi:CheY-like chemotaxis protein